MRDGLAVSEALCRPLPRLLVVADRLRRTSRRLAVSCEHLGFAGDALGKARLERVGYATVEIHALALEK